MNDIPYAEPVYVQIHPGSPSRRSVVLTRLLKQNTKQELSSVKSSSHVESMHRFRVEREVDLVAEQSSSLPSLLEGECGGQ